MATKVVNPKYQEQHGYATPGTEAFSINYFGSMAIDPGREFLLRFSDVDLPAGVTITNAYIEYGVTVKNRNQANSFTFNHFYESNASGGANMNQVTMPFRVGVAEESTTNRHWVQHITGQTFNWFYASPTVGAQTVEVSVASLIQQAYANSGRHMSLAFKMKVTAETGEFSMENMATQYLTILVIEYTGGTSRNEVVLANENPNFMMYDSTTGIPDFWYKNAVFGFFSDTTTYTTAASFGSIVAPMGGNVVRVTANETYRQAFWSRPVRDTLFGGTWSCWSGFVYVPSGVPNVQITTANALFTIPTEVTTKDAWVRLYVPFLHSTDVASSIGFASTGDMTSGQSFYVANANWTSGKMLYPYFDGNTADTVTFHRTFAWGGGTTGVRNGGIGYVVLDNAPTATIINPQATASTHQKFDIRWTYNDPYNEGQQRYRVEVRKKRVP